MSDKLDDMFEKQTELMEEFKEHDILPEWPVDLKTKRGQRFIKEYMFNMIEEMMEASFTLKNRVHKLSDDKEVDMDHYREELVDAYSYFMEVCILSGMSANDLYDGFVKKNAIVRDRLKKGY